MSSRLNRAPPLPSSQQLKLPASVLGAKTPPQTKNTRSDCALRIGHQIRALRMAAGATGGELARRSSVSRSMLSRIEHGLVSPSVETLTHIAEGLGVPVSRFFSDQDKRTDFSHVAAGRGIVIDRIGAVANYRYELLGHQLSGNLFVEPYLVTLLPDAKPYAIFQHPGIKLLHLLTGAVTYRYGARSFKLASGDTLQFDATALHGIEGIDHGPVSYLSIVFTLRE